jgi:4-hydroxy-tetrahydrodipicolinate reductase
MKIAVIGTGTTGGEVLKLLNNEQIIGPFNTKNPPTVDRLKPADATIIFVPGTAVDRILDTVLKAGITAAWGSTGYDWPKDELDSELRRRGVKWIHAANFSIGMNIVRRCMEIIGRGSNVLNHPEFAIHEIHHTGKRDAPSGTALAWQHWLGREAKITSERKGDIKGIHRLRVDTDLESIELQHEAHDRAVFAEGALWAVRQLSDTSLKPGFYTMERLFDQQLG